MTELKKTEIIMYCKECHQWLDSSKFHCLESRVCKACQIQRINDLIDK